MMRAPARASKPRLAKEKSFPAPVGGWIKNVSLSTPNARRPDGSPVNGAYLLKNWFPTATGARMRGGSAQFCTCDTTKPIDSMFTYVNGNNRKLFAADEASIFDITDATPTAFLVDEAGNYLVDELGNFLVTQKVQPVAGIGPFSGGEWIAVQFSTSGGVFLRLVNGVDTPLVFDGAGFDTSPAITGSGLTASTLSYAWAFKQRLFFIEKDSLNAWYLPADSVGGTATKLPLGGVFQRGGALLFGATWSLDTGGGLSEQCAFVTTEGEVAVYQGTDPSSSSTWSKVGVYRIGKPRGSKAFIRAGGDLVIATDIGFVPLSVAVQRDISAISPSAVSYPIEEAWNDALRDRASGNWHCEVWPAKQSVYVATTTPAGVVPQLLVANARTGAWSEYSNWNATCLQVFGDRCFFGSIAGLVIECEVTGSDQGASYSAECVPLFDPLKAPASLKIGLMGRSTVRAPSEVEVQLSLQTDFEVNLPPPPDDITLPSGSTWGTGKWGEAVWSRPPEKKTFRKWHSVGGEGYAVSLATQITSGSISAPNVELVEAYLTYDQGNALS